MTNTTNEATTTHTFTSTTDAAAHFEAQGALAPGSEGFWKVWGATVATIRVDDLVATLVDGEMRYDLVLDTFEAKAAPLRRGFVSESRFTLGALQPVVVLRWGTHHTLA